MSKKPSSTGVLDRVALLNVLGGNDIDVNASRARGAALVKFAVLAGALFYNGISHLPRRHRDFS